MNVCIIGPTYPYRGGIAHYTTLLTHHLSAAGHDTLLLSYVRQYPRWLFPGKSDRDPSATPLRVPCEYVLDPIDPRSWWRTARRIARTQPDVVILQWWVPFWAPSLIAIAQFVKRRTKAKLIFICHNVLPHEGDNRLRRLIAQAVLRHSDLLIVHSEQDQMTAQALLPHAAVRRTPHPTYAVFDQIAGTAQHDAVRRQYGIENKRVLLFFGFVRPYKGLMYLIDALQSIRDQIPDIHVLIVGEFWGAKGAYVDRIRQLGMQEHVTIVDRYVPNEDLGTYFSAADVVVLPYVSATQSGVVQMAFGFGVPVVTTRVGGLHEAVQHEHTGLLVPPQDTTALADAIVRYFRDDLGPMMRANIAAEQRNGRFAWSAIVQVLEQIEQQE